MDTFNLENSSDRGKFEDMIKLDAEEMLKTLPFNEGCESDAWQQDPEKYAQVAFENFQIVSATVESGEEATLIIDDMAKAQGLYAEIFPQAVRDWQKEMKVDHLEEEMSTLEKGYVTGIEIFPGGRQDGLAYGAVVIDIVTLEADGDQIAYRQSDDGEDQPWKIGDIVDAVDEALGVREQIIATEKDMAEMAAQDAVLAALG